MSLNLYKDANEEDRFYMDLCTTRYNSAGVTMSTLGPCEKLTLACYQ